MRIIGDSALSRRALYCRFNVIYFDAMTLNKIFLMAHLHVASAFVSPIPSIQSTRETCSSSLCAIKTPPFVVVGNINEALGAAMAICAKDAIMNPGLMERHTPVPPAQSIAFYNTDKERQQLSTETISSIQNAMLHLGPSLYNFEQILADSLQLFSRIDRDNEHQMLYTSVEFGTERGIRQLQSLSLVCNRFAFMGLNLNTDNIKLDDDRFIMSREQAEISGSKLQSFLDERNPSYTAVIMDTSTHLAMLQANSLPRCRGAIGKKDTWAIKDTTQDIDCDSNGVLFEYQYNYNDPFGGCDPLMCPSIGYIIPPVNSAMYNSISKEATDAYAAAYSASVGSGLDYVSSICIARSLESLFMKLGRPPVYSWTTIDEIVELSIEAGKSIKKEDGLPRKMYKEYGYK